MHSSLIFLMILLGMAPFASSHCNIRIRGISEDNKKVIVNKHNDFRYKVANGEESGLPVASNMRELIWDHDLAEDAQDWAEACEFEHNDPTDTNGGDAGQNIAWKQKTEKEPRWEEILQEFYDEIKVFDSNIIEKFVLSEETGHFTQIIWAKSHKIGCGYIRYRQDDEQNEFLYGCNYSPRGNVDSMPIYKTGDPCSECSSNYTCGSIKGLCIYSREEN